MNENIGVNTSDVNRALASVQSISEVSPIPNADSISLAKVLGWQCVIFKGEFKPGDKAVYFEVDSFLPEENRYEFLRKSSFLISYTLGSGFRIKTMKIRGHISQGLLLPMSHFPELESNTSIGTDVTKMLDIKKWFVPETKIRTGRTIGELPYCIPKTDEIRIQSNPHLINMLKEKFYYITTKMDGTSCTVYHRNGKVGCCSRNHEIADDPKALFWKPAYMYDLKHKLVNYGRNIAIQGELCGVGIQKNKLKLPGYEWYVFDVYDLDDHVYHPLTDLQQVCSELGLTHVPLESSGVFDLTLDKLLELAKGKYKSGVDKEGIVVRSNTVPTQVSFKVLNNDVLLKEK